MSLALIKCWECAKNSHFFVHLAKYFGFDLSGGQSLPIVFGAMYFSVLFSYIHVNKNQQCTFSDLLLLEHLKNILRIFHL
jgi:hypothetical protein